ncbi:TetR/AcrR family transcriptional regulator [Ignavigranum ruoffiae]|uniref:TetR/AcrR family transcriptional regulator n=1 Tax=Ignavigranum ruoffiae TaxID=89093 RepID=UPI002058ADFF|nr:TetR/AcrR family transcriptional regulator [Ignavigranum ruoffiae]UPQ85175.1 TetR/AcrR family transcriptional regulator [Ignavigranum ruoffiae]
MTSSNKNNLELSKESLRTALLQLMHDTPLHQIKVTQLCQKAGVSRMAYYRNYPSLLALYQDIIHSFLAEFLQNSYHYIQAGRWQDFWLKFFTYIHQHQDLVRIILNHQSQSEILHYLNQLFVPKDQEISQQQQYYIRGIIGLTYNIMLAWVESDFNLLPEDLAQLCQQMIPSSLTDQGLHQFFHPKSDNQDS